MLYFDDEFGRGKRLVPYDDHIILLALESTRNNYFVIPKRISIEMFWGGAHNLNLNSLESNCLGCYEILFVIRGRFSRLLLRRMSYDVLEEHPAVIYSNEIIHFFSDLVIYYVNEVI